MEITFVGKNLPLWLQSGPQLSPYHSLLTCLFPTCQNETLMVGPINSDIAFLFFITKVTLLQVYIWHANRNETVKRFIFLEVNLCWSCLILIFSFQGIKHLKNSRHLLVGKQKGCFFILIVKYTCKVRLADQLVLFSASVLLHSWLNAEFERCLKTIV